MKKLSITIIGIFLLIILPHDVDAASMNLSLNCSDTTAGKNTTCTLTGSGNDVAGVTAQFNITNAVITSITPSGGWEAMPGNNSTYIAYYTAGAAKNGTFQIATITISTSTAGKSTVTVKDVEYSEDSGKTHSASGISKSFTISPPATQPPQTQPPKPTTKATQRPTQTQPTAPVTEPVGTELKLDTVKVGDYEVLFQEGKYYVTVDYDTESVNVEATANPNLTLIGGGVRTLAVGKNVVEIIMRNELNQSATAQIIITRPEDTNDYSTYLTELKVVDYDFTFNKDVLEYTVYVPANVKELYVIAKSDNVNVSIMGDGLQSLSNGNSDIHVKVQYGNKAETNYVIHVKRSYTSIIMWGVIATLSAGLIGSILYFTNKLKQTTIASKEEKTKILAEANRTVAESKENVTLNGQSVVSPTSAVQSPIQPRVPNTQGQQNNQVIEKRVPTNPVAVATSTVSPTQVNTSSPTQVKLVQTLDRQPIKVNRTPIKTNGARQVVINTGKNNTR